MDILPPCVANFVIASQAAACIRVLLRSLTFCASLCFNSIACMLDVSCTEGACKPVGWPVSVLLMQQTPFADVQESMPLQIFRQPCSNLRHEEGASGSSQGPRHDHFIRSNMMVHLREGTSQLRTVHTHLATQRSKRLCKKMFPRSVFPCNAAPRS